MRGRKKNRIAHFFWTVREREEERRERKRGERGSNFSLRSMEIGWSEFVGLRTKVHILDEGYTWVPKRRDFTKDLKE